jgi:hypothetical protein
MTEQLPDTLPTAASVHLVALKVPLALLANSTSPVGRAAPDAPETIIRHVLELPAEPLPGAQEIDVELAPGLTTMVVAPWLRPLSPAPL